MIAYSRILLVYTVAVVAGMPSAHAECSDGGLCSLDHWRSLQAKQHQADDSQSWRWRYGLDAGFAVGDDETEVTYASLTPSLALQHRIGFSLAVQVPLLTLDGNDADASGLGDVIVSAEQVVARSESSAWSVQVGARLGTGDDNANPNLPQAYQLGLGGTDILFGLSWKNDNGLFVSGGYALAASANDLEGTELERGDDVLFRIGYNYAVNETWSLTGQAISLYRLDESTVDDGSGRVAVADSDGAQVNLRGDVGYALTETVQLVANAAVPLIRARQQCRWLDPKSEPGPWPARLVLARILEKLKKAPWLCNAGGHDRTVLL